MHWKDEWEAHFQQARDDGCTSRQAAELANEAITTPAAQLPRPGKREHEAHTR